jgi:hypothetical protein
MDQYPVAPGGKCTECQCWLYFRLTPFGQPNYFECDKCGRRYRTADANNYFGTKPLPSHEPDEDDDPLDVFADESECR